MSLRESSSEEEPPWEGESTTDEDWSDSDLSDSEEAHEFWKQVPWAWLANADKIPTGAEQEVLSFRDPGLAMNQEDHEKRLRPDGGAWGYLQYIPRWSDPEYNENHEVLEPPFKDSVRVSRNHGDLFNRLRPALHPNDAVKNPTEFAKRFGIHPRQSDGRSRISPTQSASRRVMLRSVQETPSGQTKDFVDITDLEAAHSEYLQKRPHDINLQNFGFEDMLQHLLDTTEGVQAEQAHALLTLTRMLTGDKAQQRLFFHGFTTDQLLEIGAMDLSNDFDSDILTANLHPFVDRKRWSTTDHLGHGFYYPKLCYHIDGVRGEWCAQDDNVWRALQPALQLVSRVLEVDHPAWLAISDLYTRRYIPTVLDSRDAGEMEEEPSNRLSMWPGAYNLNLMPKPLYKLWKLGFNVREAAMTLLTRRLRISLGHCRTDNDGNKAPEHYAVVGIENRMTEFMTVHMQIAIEPMWPLLSSAFSRAEKANLSFCLASTILHELCHAIAMATFTLICDPASWIDTLEKEEVDSITQELSDCLQEVADDVLGNFGWSDAFYEDEGVVEVGWAIENQLWGGSPTSIMAGYAHDEVSMLPIILHMQHWPMTNILPCYPNPSTELRNSHRTTALMSRPLRAAAAQRLLSSGFWDNDFAQFGCQALRLETESPVTSYTVPFRRVKEMQRIFGRELGNWMHTVRDKMVEGNLGIVAMYLDLIVREQVGYTWVYKRWHFEKKHWPSLIEKTIRIKEKIKETTQRFSTAFFLWAQPASQLKAVYEAQLATWQAEQEALPENKRSQQNMPTLEMVESELQTPAMDAYYEIMGLFARAHSFLFQQVQYIQGMTCEYLQQAPQNRKDLRRRYAETFCTLIKDRFEEFAVECFAGVEAMYHFIEGFGMIDEDTKKYLNDRATWFNTDMTMLRDCRRFVEGDNFQQEAGWVPMHEFKNISYRTQKEMLDDHKLLAMEEYNRLPHDSDIRKVLDTYQMILDQKLNIKAFDIEQPDFSAVTASIEQLLRIKKEAWDSTETQAGTEGGPFALPAAIAQAGSKSPGKQFTVDKRTGMMLFNEAVAPEHAPKFVDIKFPPITKRPVNPITIPAAGADIGFAPYSEAATAFPTGTDRPSASVLTLPPGTTGPPAWPPNIRAAHVPGPFMEDAMAGRDIMNSSTKTMVGFLGETASAQFEELLAAAQAVGVETSTTIGVAPPMPKVRTFPPHMSMPGSAADMADPKSPPTVNPADLTVPDYLLTQYPPTPRDPETPREVEMESSSSSD